LHDRVHNRLEIGGGTRDDPQDVSRRCLLLQRFGEITVALLQFLEQPHVFDCDHRLIGEGLEKRDLLFAERTYLLPANMDSSNRNALAHQRRGKYSSSS
jgi:hypothetical protein